MKALVLLTLVGAVGPARATPSAGQVWARLPREPGVRELQRAAARLAEVQPERVRSWLRRVRAAALLPQLKVRVGRGVLALQLRGLDAYVPASDAWRLDLEAGWQLDRLVFDKNELALGRETQRLAARREALLTQVARLYFERRRLQVDALLEEASEPTSPSPNPRASPEAKLERRLAIDELTAILDGLTGGALGGGAR